MRTKLDQTQRNLIGEKFLELANLSVVALVVTQLLNPRIVFLAFGAGITLFLGLYAIAITIMKGGEPK